jgi:hypothetical protein
VLKQPTARVPGSHRIFAKRAIPVGTEHLQRLMHNVPTEDSAMFTASELYGHVANCLPWRRMKHKAISHCGFTIDNFRLPTLDHWQNTALVNPGVNALLSRDLASVRIRP